jgi:MFS family permease
LFYLLDVLSSAGLNELLSHNYTVFISGLNLGTTLLSMACVDRFGRKPLLLVGAFGMAMCLFGLGLTIPHHAKPIWYLIILVAYNGFFAFSQGTIVWIYLSELFPFGVRGAGQGFGAAVHWIANALLILLFPVLRRAAPAHGFYLFAGMMVLQVGVVLLWYPETKGTPLGASIDNRQP